MSQNVPAGQGNGPTEDQANSLQQNKYQKRFTRSTVTSWLRTKINSNKIDVDTFTRFTFDQKQRNGNKRYLCEIKGNIK